MKSFVEEYGKVIIVAIVMVALIAIAILFANGGTDSLKSIFTNFGLRAGFPNYEMIEAPKTINAGETARFVSEAKFGKFVEVQIDGKKVEPANYTSEGDTTKITLKAEYTDTMEAGKHTIDVISNDGFARAEFSVKFFGAVFSDGQKLGWSELQKSANGRKYGYKSHYITDTALQNQAFSRCTSLTSITIPDSVTSIGMDAFSRCTSLTSITIPDSVTSIGINAFENCTSLTSITIPDSVTSIAGYTFDGCTSLTSITIPDSVTSIKDNAFYNCTSLTSITIPDSVTSIAGYTFYGCTSLTSITIPDSVTSIGMDAFLNCTGLASITIPDSVTSIGMDAFSNCTSLTSITIPKEITIINSDTFLNCSSLESVTLSNKVDTFDDGSFQNCINLKEFNYSGTKSEWKSIYKDNGAYQHGWLDGVTTSNIVVHCSDGDRGIYN